MRFFTYAKDALRAKHVWQKLRFTAGKGYWLFGRKPAPVPAAKPIQMYDSVTLSEIPAGAAAVAGYVGGRWPTFPEVVKQFPHALHLSIAVNASEDADVLDVESGDASNDQAAGWFHRQVGRGLRRPVFYTSVSNAVALMTTLRNAGVQRSQYRLWTAHYNAHPHLCSKEACGWDIGGSADATQFDDRALGRNLDESRCAPGFFEAQL